MQASSDAARTIGRLPKDATVLGDRQSQGVWAADRCEGSLGCRQHKAVARIQNPDIVGAERRGERFTDRGDRGAKLQLAQHRGIVLFRTKSRCESGARHHGINGTKAIKRRLIFTEFCFDRVTNVGDCARRTLSEPASFFGDKRTTDRNRDAKRSHHTERRQCERESKPKLHERQCFTVIFVCKALFEPTPMPERAKGSFSVVFASAKANKGAWTKV